ncbi:DUF3800 domain-containing protein [Flavobacteriales bacterium]|nr:DUF3800 domain-containing protein [Flavobacteriales bacterium]
MRDEKAYIYFDEYGNTHLDTESKSGTFSHFIYTAIVIDENNLEKAIDIRQKVSDNYRQGSPLKSSKKLPIDKRLKMITEFNELDFGIFSLVIDKRKIDNKNLEDKKTFIKFFQRLFLKQFVNRYKNFEIYFDKTGDKAFKESLYNYVNKRIFSPTLFEPDRKYIIADDKYEEPLIQIADFFSGCVGKIYCVSHKDKDADKIFDAINKKLFVDFLPFTTSNYLGNYSEDLDANDKKIREFCLNLTIEYLKTKKCTIEESELLKHLLLIFKTNPNKLAETYELVNVLKRINLKIEKEQIREIISSLRYKGILVVSIEGKYGYKIPNKKNDLVGYYNRYLKSIIPMLTKINIANNAIKKEYFEIDIINENESLSLLQNLINVVEYKKIE